MRKITIFQNHRNILFYLKIFYANTLFLIIQP